MNLNLRSNFAKILFTIVTILILGPGAVHAQKQNSHNYMVQSDLVESSTISLPDGITKIKKGNFNNDDKNDYILLTESGNLLLIEGKSKKLGKVKNISKGKEVNDFTVADLNNDLIEDVVFVSNNKAFRLISKPKDKETFKKPTRIFPASSKLKRVRATDIEIDGSNEVAVSSKNKIHILNNGSKVSSLNVKGKIKNYFFLDFDSNLRSDLVVHSVNPTRVSYFKGLKDKKYKLNFNKKFKQKELKNIKKIGKKIYFNLENKDDFLLSTSNVVGKNTDKIEVGTTSVRYPFEDVAEAKTLNFDRFAFLDSISADKRIYETVFLNQKDSTLYRTVMSTKTFNKEVKAKLHKDSSRVFSDFVVTDINSDKARDVILADNKNNELVILINKDEVCSYQKDPVCTKINGEKKTVRNKCLAKKKLELAKKYKRLQGKEVTEEINIIKDDVCSADKDKYKEKSAFSDFGECLKYRPVCGKDGVTYFNKCWASSFDKDYYLGKCEPMKVNQSICKLSQDKLEKKLGTIKKEVAKGKDRKELEKSSSLDIIPRREYYTSYLDQVVPMCEANYGEKNKSNSLRSKTSKKEESSKCPLKEGSPYKIKSSPTVYLVSEDIEQTQQKDESCKLMPIEQSSIYFEYFNSWSDVNTTKKSKINQIESIGFAPRGPKANLKNQSLVTAPFTNKVYLNMDQNIYLFESLAALKSQGFEPSDIIDIHAELLQKLKTNKTMNTISTERNNLIPGLVYKKQNSVDVYLNQNNGRRKFNNLQNLKNFSENNSYNLDNIAEVDLKLTPKVPR
jgi:hypothetical protein